MHAVADEIRAAERAACEEEAEAIASWLNMNGGAFYGPNFLKEIVQRIRQRHAKRREPIETITNEARMHGELGTQAEVRIREIVREEMNHYGVAVRRLD